MRQLEVDRCDPIYNQITGVVYIFTARLYPTDHQQIAISQTLLFEHFEKLFRSAFFEGYRIQGDDYSVHTSFCYRNIEAVVKSVCEITDDNRFACSFEVEFYNLELHIAISQYHSLSDMVNRYLNMTKSQPIMEIAFGDDAFHFIIMPRQPDKSMSDSFDQTECSPKAERIILANQNSCPLVELSYRNYQWVEEDGEIFFNYSNNVVLNRSQVLFNFNRTSILI